MSTTPKTDAVTEVCNDGSNEFHGEWVNADFARKLERENTRLREWIIEQYSARKDDDGRWIDCGGDYLEILE